MPLDMEARARRQRLAGARAQRERRRRAPRRAPPASPGGTRQPVRSLRGDLAAAPAPSPARRRGRDTTTGVPIACASTAERPKASGSVEGTVDDRGGEKGRRHVGAMADAAHDARRGPAPRSARRARARSRRGPAGRRRARRRRRRGPRALSFAAASISTFWPFQPVRRAASSTMRSCGATPQAWRSASTRSGATRGGREGREIGAAVDDADALRRPADRASGSGPPCSASWR